MNLSKFPERISPNHINELSDNEIFVFGSNLKGIHGAGAAKTARQWGAVIGIPEGIQGKTYAIPTKDAEIKNPLELEQIKSSISTFIDFAKSNKHLKFLVVEIGCNLAGRTPAQIAPLFRDAIEVDNIYLPRSFWMVLNKEYYESIYKS